jgi:hypothetical protein
MVVYSRHCRPLDKEDRQQRVLDYARDSYAALSFHRCLAVQVVFGSVRSLASTQAQARTR